MTEGELIALGAGCYGGMILAIILGFALLKRWDRRPSRCEHAPSLVDSLVDLTPAPAPESDEDWLADQPAEVLRPSKAEIDARIAALETELANLR